MRERSIFLYIVSIAGVALSFLQSGGDLIDISETATEARDILFSPGLLGAPLAHISIAAAENQNMILIVVAMLAVVVLVSIALLFNQIGKNSIARVSGIIAFLITAWTTGSAALPLAAMTALSCLSTTKIKLSMAGWLSLLFCLVMLGLFLPGGMIIITTALLLGFSLYTLKLIDRIARSDHYAERHANEANEMREMLGSQRRMVKSTEHVSRLEERNRLAARIHDEIGHGMSGSILLLEGANMVMDSDPEKARETIVKVAENLRESVEEIRKVLREERSAGAEVDLARIKSELTTFESNHPKIKTRLITVGNMEEVNRAVWTSIYENMVEALTNTLKHSDATIFTVELKNSGGLLRAELSDNGGKHAFSDNKNHEPKKNKGIGLQNMEERAAMCYGRCFFRHEDDGFHIIMTFPRKGEV